MKVESMQSPVAKYEITFIDKDYAEVDFFTGIQKKQRKKYENSEEMIEYYEYDNYKIKVRNRANLSTQIEANYEQWLQYAMINDDREHIPTELELVQLEYAEWETMDTPSTIEEMKQQDPAMAEEYLNIMIEMRGLIYTLSVSDRLAVGYSSIHLPKPSKPLEDFKNKFNKFKK